MTREQATTIVTFAKHNLNATDTAKELHIHRNTLLYRLNKIDKDTGLDPRSFQDLIQLVVQVNESHYRGEL